MQTIQFTLRGEFITLDRLLKATGLAGSGGHAKALVAEGNVQVDGRDEMRKTAKLRAGQVVSLASTRIKLLAADIAAAALEHPQADDITRPPTEGDEQSSQATLAPEDGHA